MHSGDIVLWLLGIIVGLLAVAAPILWPNQKWVAWVACSVAGALLAAGVFLAFGSLPGVLVAELILVVATTIAFRSASRPKRDNKPVLLRVDDPRIKPEAVHYSTLNRRLYFAHINVINSRPDLAALDCEMRLVKIESPSLGERPSHDTKPLKVTEARDSYALTISSSFPGIFDLFGIDAESFPNTYLLTNADVLISPILTTPEIHFLTYEIFAIGFSTITAKIGLDLTGAPPPTNPSTTIHTGSGVPVSYSVEDPSRAPLKWVSAPKIWIVEQGPKFELPH